MRGREGEGEREVMWVRDAEPRGGSPSSPPTRNKHPAVEPSGRPGQCRAAGHANLEPAVRGHSVMRRGALWSSPQSFTRCPKRVIQSVIPLGLAKWDPDGVRGKLQTAGTPAALTSSCRGAHLLPAVNKCPHSPTVYMAFFVFSSTFTWKSFPIDPE